jgi:uncharacterized damage-inducible protein DinB
MSAFRDYLIELWRYVRWADERTLQNAATMPAEGFFREQNISIGSVHKLLVHSMAAQQIWLARWTERGPMAFAEPKDYPRLDSIRTAWVGVHDEIADFVGRQTDESLQKKVRYRRGDIEYWGVLGKLIPYTADHATYHRGQIHSMIKLGGGSAQEASFIIYQRQEEGQPT